MNDSCDDNQDSHKTHKEGENINCMNDIGIHTDILS